jgi:hypothetical protein
MFYIFQKKKDEEYHIRLDLVAYVKAITQDTDSMTLGIMFSGGGGVELKNFPLKQCQEFLKRLPGKKLGK